MLSNHFRGKTKDTNEWTHFKKNWEQSTYVNNNDVNIENTKNPQPDMQLLSEDKSTSTPEPLLALYKYDIIQKVERKTFSAFLGTRTHLKLFYHYVVGALVQEVSFPFDHAFENEKTYVRRYHYKKKNISRWKSRKAFFK